MSIRISGVSRVTDDTRVRLTLMFEIVNSQVFVSINTNFWFYDHKGAQSQTKR